MKLFCYTHFSPVGYERQGGGAITVWETIRILSSDANVEMCIAYRSESGIHEEPSWYEQRSNLSVVPVSNPDDLVSEIQSYGPDVFHGVDVFCEKAILYCKTAGISTVYDVRSVACWPTQVRHKLGPPFLKNWKAFFHNRKDRRVASLADRVVRPSNAAVNSAIKNYGLKAESVVRVYNSVDTNIYYPKKSPNDSIKLVNAGRVAFDRHFKMTIEIYLRLKKNWPELTLDLAGDGHLKAELEQWVENEKIEGVKFLGVLNRHELAEFYRTGDILVNTSAMESFGNVVAEAMATGLPTVCFSVGSLLELVVENETGFLNEFGDVDAHVNSVEKLLKDRNKLVAMGNAGVKRVETKFLENTKRLTLLNLYSELIDE